MGNSILHAYLLPIFKNHNLSSAKLRNLKLSHCYAT